MPCQNINYWCVSNKENVFFFLIAIVKQGSIMGIVQFKCVSEQLFCCLQTDNSKDQDSRLRALSLGLCRAIKEMEMRRQDLCEVFFNV